MMRIIKTLDAKSGLQITQYSDGTWVAEKKFDKWEQGSGNSLLEAICNLSSEIYRTGSYFWHSHVAEMLLEVTEWQYADIVNTGGDPFDYDKTYSDIEK